MNCHMMLQYIWLETVFEYDQMNHTTVRESLILLWIYEVEPTLEAKPSITFFLLLLIRPYNGE